MPSGIWGPLGRRTLLSPEHIEHLAKPGRALTDDEILEIIEGYGRSARQRGGTRLRRHRDPRCERLSARFVLVGGDEPAHRPLGRRPRERNALARKWYVRCAAVRATICRSFTASRNGSIRIAMPPTPIRRRNSPTCSSRWQKPESTSSTPPRGCSTTPRLRVPKLNLAGWAKKITGCVTITGGGIGIGRSFFQSRAPGPPQSTDNMDKVMRRFERGEFDLIASARAILNDAAWCIKSIARKPLKPYDNATLRAVL